MFRLIAINFSQKSHNFSLLSPTSPCELSEREVTSPSNLKVFKSPDQSSKMVDKVGGPCRNQSICYDNELDMNTE